MGEPAKVWEERIKLLNPYQINGRVIELCGNPEVKFLHCLPANRGEEVTSEVVDCDQSIVFDRAENR